MDYERKYLKYKNKYLFLKKQIGGQRKVNIYDKANYRNLLYTIDLDEDDDINVLKYKILEKMNVKTAAGVAIYAIKNNLFTIEK